MRILWMAGHYTARVLVPLATLGRFIVVPYGTQPGDPRRGSRNGIFGIRPEFGALIGFCCWVVFGLAILLHWTAGR